MKIKLYILLVGVILMGTVQPAAAQQRGALRILVLSGRNGTPLLGANVQLTLLTHRQGVSRYLYGASTNGHGLAEFHNIPFGSYKIRITYIGYKNYTGIIPIDDTSLKLLKVTLKSKVGKLKRLTVEGQRQKLTGAGIGVYKITPKEISRVPAPGLSGSLVAYLQTLPGVITSGDRGGELYIRGGTPTQNRILVDNLPIEKPFHISNLFSAVPGDMVKTAKLYAGGFGAKYYSATSSILDINLRAGNMKSFEASAGVGTHLASVSVEGPISSNASSYLITARKSLIGLTSSYLGVNKNAIGFYDITARITARTRNNYTCNITAIHTHDQGKINPALNTTLSWQNSVIGATCLGYGGTYEYPIQYTVGYSHYKNSKTRPGRKIQSSKKSQLYIKINQKFRGFGLPFTYGAGLNIRTYKTTLSKRFVDVQSFDISDVNLHGFLALNWKINKYVTLNPSVGAEFTEHFAIVYPRMQTSFYPTGTKQYKISLAGGLYYQSDTGIRDNRDAGTVFTVLKPVTDPDKALPSAWQAIMGFDANVNHFRFSLGSYYIIRKTIPVSKWTPVAKINIHTALANGVSYGLDARIIYNKVPFYFSLSYGWAKVKYKAATKNLGAWVGGTIFEYYPPQDRRNKVNFVGSYTFGDYTISASWQFGSGKPYTRVFGFDLALNFPYHKFPLEFPVTDPGTPRTLFSRPYGARLPTYHRLDVSIKRSFRFSSNTTLTAEVGAINVFNRQNIFYFDSDLLERVNQTSFMPYISTRISF